MRLYFMHTSAYLKADSVVFLDFVSIHQSHEDIRSKGTRTFELMDQNFQCKGLDPGFHSFASQAHLMKVMRMWGLVPACTGHSVQAGRATPWAGASESSQDFKLNQIKHLNYAFAVRRDTETPPPPPRYRFQQ